MVEVAGGYQIVTRPELHEWVRRLFHERTTQKLSVASLETLAVIAYKQPVTAPEIAEIRGVNTSGVLGTLVERKLVKIVGPQAGRRPPVPVRHDARVPRALRPERSVGSAEGRGHVGAARLRSAAVGRRARAADARCRSTDEDERRAITDADSHFSSVREFGSTSSCPCTASRRAARRMMLIAQGRVELNGKIVHRARHEGQSRHRRDSRRRPAAEGRAGQALSADVQARRRRVRRARIRSGGTTVIDLVAAAGVHGLLLSGRPSRLRLRRADHSDQRRRRSPSASRIRATSWSARTKPSSRAFPTSAISSGCGAAC